MSRTLRNIVLGLDDSLEEHLSWLVPDHGEFRILRQSIDARRRHDPRMVYSVEVFDRGEKIGKPKIELEKVKGYKGLPVVILGAGPAGLFAALRLSERGVPCILLEQGSVTEKRVIAIGKFWRRGELDPLNNVGFGEGGAGLFSDGKLITRIKSEHIPYVMQRLVQFGAPPEIEYLANPHVGSDRIRRVIPKLREHLLALGADLRFDSKVTEIELSSSSGPSAVTAVRLANGERIPCERLILACGHSAEDLFTHLRDIGVHIEGKSFAVGLRIEHPQDYINEIQYRQYKDHPKLGAANYKLAFHDQAADVGVYSFCMCPGGYVLSCATSPDRIVSNGMSNYKRNSRFANSALVVTVNHAKSFEDTFGGLEFRRQLENRAFILAREAGARNELPAQTLPSFLEGKSSPVGESSCPSGVVSTRLDLLMGEEFKKHLWTALQTFDRRMKGFISDKALLHGVESRTSCPIRITRDPQTLQSLSHQGLYPCGEGAGYAGGITSAACDGIRVADAIVARNHRNQSA